MSDAPKVDVKALAALARLEVSDAEVAKLEQEIPAILKFVEQIQSAVGEVKAMSPELRNVMRADGPPAGGPHTPGEYTERLLKAAPKSEDEMVVVKQVVSRKNK